MFQVNDHVIYGSTGVCKIVDIRMEKFGGTLAKEYFVISPVFGDTSVIFAPVDKADATMRRTLTVEEVMSLIKAMPQENCDWIDNDTQRKISFVSAIKDGDHAKLFKLIKTVCAKRTELATTGKKLHIADENAVKAAEKLLYNEFALVLDIAPEKVVPFIREEIMAPAI